MDSSSTKMPLRGYQKQALEHIAQQSTIVVLPTGAGKTLIAAKAAHRHFTATGQPILFLVPTKLLVAQQADAFEAATSLRVARFHGEIAVPVASSFDALVATPAAVLAQQRNADLALQTFGMVVFDEVHHVVKNHPYRKVAVRLQNLPEDSRPKILGLSASLTYAIGKEGIKKDVHNLCGELCLSYRCLYTATNEQLLEDGYKANAAVAQLSQQKQQQQIPAAHAAPPVSSSGGSSDSRGSCGDDDSNVDDVTLGTDSLLIDTPPHTLIPVMLSHVRNRSSPPLHGLTLQLFDTIAEFEKIAKNSESSFQSPIWDGKSSKKGKSKPLRLKEWGEYVVKQQGKVSRSSKGARRDNGQASSVQGVTCIDASTATALEVLEHLYEAARLVVASQQEALELAMMYLDMTGVFKGAEVRGGALGALAQQWLQGRASFTRAQHLQEELLKLTEKHGSGLRCVVFVQQRLTTHILEHALNTSASPSVRGLKTACVYATTSPASPKLRVTKQQAAERVAAFASGQVSVLLATSVAEEGMDVPAANCVVRFDEVQTAVSLVQSRGRARQEDSSFLLLKENASRPLAALEDAVDEQRSVIADIARLGLPHDGASQREARMRAQSARLANPNAKAVLKRFSDDKEVSRPKARALLNGYAQKVKADVAEGGCRKGKDGTWEASLTISWFGGVPVHGTGKAAGKKAAGNAAAFQLLSQIASQQ